MRVPHVRVATATPLTSTIQCYTFNFNDSVELKNSRAGPMYGLRLLLNVNQSDYLPNTEAAGVRLVIHEQDQVDAQCGIGRTPYSSLGTVSGYLRL